MSLRSKFLLGLKWTALNQIAFQAINYASLIVLANLVSTDDFGTLALSTVFIGFFEILNGFGLGQYIISKGVRDSRVLSALATASLLLSLCLLALTLLGGFAYAHLFAPDDTVAFYSVLVSSALVIPLHSLTGIYSSLYSRDLSYRFQSTNSTVALLLANAAAISIACMGHGISSLVARNVLPPMFALIGYTLNPARKLRLTFHIAPAKPALLFSFHISGFSLANYLIRNIDYLLVGAAFGRSTLGEYYLAYRIMLVPMKLVSSKVSAILFPLLAHVKDSQAQVERIYIKCIHAIGLVVLPTMALAATLAQQWVPVLFRGHAPNLPILVSILGLVGAAQAITSPVGALFLLNDGERELHKNALKVLAVTCVVLSLASLTPTIATFSLCYALLHLLFVVPYSNSQALKLASIPPAVLLRGLRVPILTASGASLVAASVALALMRLPPVLQCLIAGGCGLMTVLLLIPPLSGHSLPSTASMLRGLLRDAAKA